MSDAPKVLVSCEGGIARVDINRPEVRNAFDGETIALLIESFQSLAEDPEARVIVLGGRGKSFCAGADLKWMMSMAAKNALANSSDANVLASFFDVVNACPKPVIGRVHGAVRGGGLGLVAACDVPVAVAGVTFAFTEVRLGLAPAVISPYVIARIGVPAARELFLTGAKFDAARARELSLVHYVAEDEAELDAIVDRIAADMVKGGPEALAACKHLAMTVSDLDHDTAATTTAALIARLRASDEGREGMAAFLQRRPAGWIPS